MCLWGREVAKAAGESVLGMTVGGAGLVIYYSVGPHALRRWVRSRTWTQFCLLLHLASRSEYEMNEMYDIQDRMKWGCGTLGVESRAVCIPRASTHGWDSERQADFVTHDSPSLLRPLVSSSQQPCALRECLDCRPYISILCVSRSMSEQNGK